MHSKLLIFFLLILCAESLTPPQFKSSSLYLKSNFNRISNGLRNFVREISSHRRRHYGANSYPPETFLSTPEIIRYHGYPVEEHKVKTEDGYIISIFRIIRTQKHSENENELERNESTGKREPVLVHHGISCSSDDFLQLNPKDILPYLLADSGHNVWLGNIQGGPFGKEHSNNMSSNDPKFYDFTMDDLARDVPQIIKYILKVENVPQLSYVCHSMGCTILSMAVSDHPELNQLIKKGTFMAPGPYCTHIFSLSALAALSLPESVLLAYSNRFAGGQVSPLRVSLALRKYAPGICLRESTRHFCNIALFFWSGFNPGQITNETLVKVFSHFPADTAAKIYVHNGQVVKSGKFQKYDFGREKNLELYGSAKPPLYNLSRVVFPVQGFYGLNDNTIPAQDVLRTWSELGNVVEAIQVDDENWAHLDFLYGKDARRLVYDKIARFLSS